MSAAKAKRRRIEDDRDNPLRDKRQALLKDIGLLASTASRELPGYAPGEVARRLRGLANDLDMGRFPRIDMMRAAAIALRGIEEYDARIAAIVAAPRPGGLG